MPRFRNYPWSLPEIGKKASPLHWTHVQVAVLMDVRDEIMRLNDEMKKLNALLGCPNFTAVPDILRGIRKKLPSREERLRRK